MKKFIVKNEIGSRNILTVTFETKGYHNSASDILELCGMLDNSKALLLKKLNIILKKSKK